MSARQGLLASPEVEDVLTNHYRVLKDIGQGSFATIKLARHILTSTEVAVKVLPKAGALAFPSEEVAIMKAVEHPHIVQVFQVIESPGHVYIVMEHGGGPLTKYIPADVGMQEGEARRVLRQVASALHYCHGHGIAHRDLKADNILMDVAGRVRLCDFGLACRFTAGEKLHSLCGTLAHWAPELFRCQSYEGPPVDVWSLGVLLFLLVTGRFPFDGTTIVQLGKQVLELSYNIPARVSAEVGSLISSMLTAEPALRPTAHQVMGHPWLSRGEKHPPSARTEALPRHPDPSILLTMFELGYSLQNTWLSVTTGQFDEASAAYRMLRLQKDQGAGRTVHPEPARPEVAPCPCPSDPPRGSASEPAGHSPREQLPLADKLLGQRGRRSASLPPLALCGLPPRTPTASLPSLPSLRSSCWSSTCWPETDGQFSEAVPSKPTSVSEPPTCCARSKAKGWRRVSKRIAACLRRMCCCVCSSQTDP